MCARLWMRIVHVIFVASCIGVPFIQGRAASKAFICNSPPDSFLASRSFLLSQDKRWPRGIVPYEIDPEFTNEQVVMIKASMKMFSDNSCVRWVPRFKHHDYVKFTHTYRKGMCNSGVGRKGGMQTLNLSDDCFDVNNGFQGAITHEMMHAIGFIHEQQRMDRECFVRVAKNVANSHKYDYGITLDTETRFPYDFGSIMHYGSSDNMRSHTGERLGNFEGEFTELDKWKLKNMYCGGKPYCEVYPDDCKKFLSVQNRCYIKS